MDASGIPPPFINSAIQATQGQRQSSEASSVDEARSAHAQTKQVTRNEEMDSTVETADAETRVNTDGGGLGSQGRHHGSAGEGEEVNETEQSGIIQDEDGQLHLDLEA